MYTQHLHTVKVTLSLNNACAVFVCSIDTIMWGLKFKFKPLIIELTTSLLKWNKCCTNIQHNTQLSKNWLKSHTVINFLCNYLYNQFLFHQDWLNRIYYIIRIAATLFMQGERKKYSFAPIIMRNILSYHYPRNVWSSNIWQTTK